MLSLNSVSHRSDLSPPFSKLCKRGWDYFTIWILNVFNYFLPFWIKCYVPNAIETSLLCSSRIFFLLDVFDKECFEIESVCQLLYFISFWNLSLFRLWRKMTIIGQNPIGLDDRSWRLWWETSISPLLHLRLDLLLMCKAARILKDCGYSIILFR